MQLTEFDIQHLRELARYAATEKPIEDMELKEAFAYLYLEMNGGLVELIKRDDKAIYRLTPAGCAALEANPVAEPAPATDAPMSDFVELLLKQQNATPEQRQAVRDSLSKAKTDAAAVSGYEGIPPAALYQNWCDTSDLLRKAEERAERAEAALTDVGARLEIADTRNTDMVLALERAEAEAKRLREAIGKISAVLSEEYGDYDDDHFYHEDGTPKALRVCFDVIEALDASEGGAG